MRTFARIRIVAGVGMLLPAAGLAQVVTPSFPEGYAAPRNATAEELAWASMQPARRFPRGPGGAPTGPLVGPGEYAPCDGLLLAWEGGTTLNQIQSQMIRHITTTGNAKVYLMFDTTAERDGQMNIATSILRAQNPDLAKVVPVVRTTDTIWIRDYGPRYVYEGDCRVISDHTYNRYLSRPNDDAQPIGFADVLKHARYTLPLIHGGGNYHLDSIGNGFATTLISNENPSLGATPAVRDAAVIGLWQQHWGVTTTLFPPFPTNVDATQHIDMWMQVIADDKVVIAQWPAPAVGGTPTTQYTITENTATFMASRGYQVYRTPSRLVGTTHYTYTNMVMCNDLVLLPSYTNSTMAPLNAGALATLQAALPGKTIVQINSDALAVLAGVMHCIVMHVPVNKNGQNPGVYVRTQNEPATLVPGASLDVRWISDDDVGVSSVDVELSYDGGQTWPVSFASLTDDGQHAFAVPNVHTFHARVRVVARDGSGRTGSDLGDAELVIAGTCVADYNGTDGPTLQDIFDFLNGWFAGSLQADTNGVDGVTLQDIFDFLNAWFAGC